MSHENDPKDPTTPESQEEAPQDEVPRDRGRRRLLRLAIYAPPTILGLSSFIGRAYAQSPKVSAGTSANSDSLSFVKAQ